MFDATRNHRLAFAASLRFDHIDPGSPLTIFEISYHLIIDRSRASYVLYFFLQFLNHDII